MAEINITLTIEDGEAASNIYSPTGPLLYHLPIAGIILAKSTIATSVSPYVCDTVGGTYTLLQSGGSNIVLATLTATPIMIMPAMFLKLVSDGNVTGDKVFQFIGNRIATPVFG
jgi:hypothetical protein